MTYNPVSVFGNVYFNLSDVKVSFKNSTLKTNIGKSYVEKNIPLRNVKDKILQINGIITGLSQTSGQTKATAISNDRTSLEELDDGIYHAYSDGEHTGNYVIMTDSLNIEDNADRVSGEPIRFTLTLIQWQ